jgi:SAM-dependent methyltransferase
MDPAKYDAWYRTRRGGWIGERETRLLLRLLLPSPGMSLLDAGSGTGYFTRRFTETGLRVTGLEPDPKMLDYARHKHPDIPFVRGDLTTLPFRGQSFDFVAAVTSLCFVTKPHFALQEMWRTASRGIVVGLLNRKSALYRRKAGKDGYAGARWDTLATALEWGARLDPPPVSVHWATAVFLPGGSIMARTIERVFPRRLPWGAFQAVCWS